MTSRGEQPTITRRRHVLACARCRARRVKCDRAQPACSNCAKAGALCQPAQQSPAPSHTSVPSRSGTRDPSEYTRISKLEEEVARLSREVDSNSPSREASLSPALVDTGDLHSPQSRGKILQGFESGYFSPFSWAAVAEELSDIEAMVQDSPQEPGAADSSPTSSSTDQSQAFHFLDDSLHETLLNIFRHRVDPLVRILHWPSFLEQYRSLRRRRTSHAQGSPNPQYSGNYYPATGFEPTEQRLYSGHPIVPTQGQRPYPDLPADTMHDIAFMGLLYAVYYAAVVSILDSPNQPDLGQNLSAFNLASTFRQEVTTRVFTFDETTARVQSIQILQAMVLALSMEPDCTDFRLPWLRTGVAIRMARNIGVHRDGTNFDLRPIDVEVRRRIWAQLCILDVRYAAYLGQEPTITADSYDTALPLSIDDRDLSEIEAQDAASRKGQDTSFKTHQEVEYAQERQSPFSPVSFLLGEAEIARLMGQLLTIRYRARDALFHASASSPQLSRKGRSSSATPSDKAQWIGRLEHRFQTVYSLPHVEATNPLQYLVSELATINIARAKFVFKMMEWKDGYGLMSTQRKDGETIRLFHEAMGLVTRVLTLIQQYNSSPYCWYTKRIADIYTSAFLALNLAAGRHIDHESAIMAWSALDQLYPPGSAGTLVEPCIAQCPFGKLLANARARRQQLQVSSTQELRAQAMHAAAGGGPHAFSSSMAPPASAAGMPGYQSSGNMFADFDAMMQDPMWPHGMAGMDSPYGSWAVPQSASTLSLPSPHPPQPFEQPRTYQNPSRPIGTNLSSHRLDPTKPPNAGLKSAMHSEIPKQLSVPSLHIESATHSARDASMIHEFAVTPTHSPSSAYNSPNSPLIPSRTWPLNQEQLQVPPRTMRERSASQPQPQQPNFLEVAAPKVSRAKSMTMKSETRPSYTLSPDTRAFTAEPEMLPDQHSYIHQQAQLSFPLRVSGA